MINVAITYNAVGCGVFRNDVSLIATIFCKFLQCEFKGIFEEVIFAIVPLPAKNLEAFEYVFRKLI